MDSPQPRNDLDTRKQDASPISSTQTAATTAPQGKRLTFKEKMTRLLSYFNVSADLLPQAEVEQDIRDGVSFRGSQLLVLIFAIFVASLGLNTDSVAVIIGAMLISPLMGPIMGMGLALGVEDFDLLRRSLKNIGMAILGSVIASAIFFLISPQYEGSSQLLARTSPSIYDVFIALFGGAAGIVSTACRNKGQVLPGVAIATSLMPPLCTAGYGLATWQAHFFFGAFYLFFTNMIFIFFATWVGLKLMGYKRHRTDITRRYRRIQWIVYTIVACTIGVSAYLTVQMIRKNIFISAATSFVENQMVFPNTQVLNHNEYIKNGKRYISVTLIGETLPKDSLQLAMMNKLDSVGLGGTVLDIHQGFGISATSNAEQMDDSKLYALMQSQLEAKQNTVDSLRNVIGQFTTFSAQGASIASELKVLFPNVRDIAMSNIIATNTVDSLSRDTVNVVFVNAPGGINAAQQRKITDYIKVRLHIPEVHIDVNPRNFPWPVKKAAR